MTLSKRDIKLLFILLGAVFLLIGYFAVYSPFTAKTEAVEEETNELKPRLEELREYFENIDTYKAGIEKAKQTVQTEMKHYPTDVRPENMILYAQTLHEKFGVDVTGMSFDDPLSILTFKGVEEQGNDTQVRELTAFQRSMTITCNLNYQQMKDMITYINTNDPRTSVDSINISYDSESGELTGDATLIQYFVTGEGDKYIAADVPNVKLGRENLFGTVS
jgi:hypothetical protein